MRLVDQCDEMNILCDILHERERERERPDFQANSNKTLVLKSSSFISKMYRKFP